MKVCFKIGFGYLPWSHVINTLTEEHSAFLFCKDRFGLILNTTHILPCLDNSELTSVDKLINLIFETVRLAVDKVLRSLTRNEISTWLADGVSVLETCSWNFSICEHSWCQYKVVLSEQISGQGFDTLSEPHNLRLAIITALHGSIYEAHVSIGTINGSVALLLEQRTHDSCSMAHVKDYSIFSQIKISKALSIEFPFIHDLTAGLRLCNGFADLPRVWKVDILCKLFIRRWVNWAVKLCGFTLLASNSVYLHQFFHVHSLLLKFDNHAFNITLISLLLFLFRLSISWSLSEFICSKCSQGKDNDARCGLCNKTHKVFICRVWWHHFLQNEIINNKKDELILFISKF